MWFLLLYYISCTPVVKYDRSGKNLRARGADWVSPCLGRYFCLDVSNESGWWWRVTSLQLQRPGGAYVSPVTLLQEVLGCSFRLLVPHCLSATYLKLASSLVLKTYLPLVSCRCSPGPKGQPGPDRWKGHLTTVLKNAPNFFSSDLRGIWGMAAGLSTQSWSSF